MSHLKPIAKVATNPTEYRQILIEVTLFQGNEAMKTKASSTVPQMVKFREELDAVILQAQEAQERINSEDQERYCLELGIDTPDAGRVCAVEAGPFETSAEAVQFAMFAKGRNAVALEGSYSHVEWYDISAEDSDSDAPIVGATLNVFTHRGGTTSNIDLY